MCFDHDSLPPLAPMAGAAIDSHSLELLAADGNRFAAFRADAAKPSGTGIIVLPDVRGLFPYYEELALRFAEMGVDAIAIDYFGRTAGASARDAEFEYTPHVHSTTWPGLQADVAAAAADLRAERGVTALFSVGFCFGGRISMLLAGLASLDMRGVIGFYGQPTMPHDNGMPAPADVAAGFRCPVLAIYGGSDPGITPQQVATYEGALTAAGVQHSIVTYPDAPHSFFDRKQDTYVDASAAAWGEVLAFIDTGTRQPD